MENLSSFRQRHIKESVLNLIEYTGDKEQALTSLCTTVNNNWPKILNSTYIYQLGYLQKLITLKD